MTYLTLTATYTPQRTDDLMPDAKAFAGWRGKWLYAGTQTDDAPYPGQLTYTPLAKQTPFVWAPLCDLSEVEGE